MKANKEDFLRVIELHQGIINTLCNLYYKDPHDRKDTRQDIILQLWKSFSSFRGESKISTWIYKVSLNTILSKIRKECKKPQEVSLDPIHENRQTLFVAVDDDLLLLDHLIESLKDLDKAIVILHLEGYRNKEIAQVLELTPSNISTRLNRIKTELKAKFSNVNYAFK